MLGCSLIITEYDSRRRDHGFTCAHPSRHGARQIVGGRRAVLPTCHGTHDDGVQSSKPSSSRRLSLNFVVGEGFQLLYFNERANTTSGRLSLNFVVGEGFQLPTVFQRKGKNYIGKGGARS